MLVNALDNDVSIASSNAKHAIPVGPVTLLELAEVFLERIDQFISRLKQAGALRFYDDFELVFDFQSYATSALEKIELKLSDYRLSVNAIKTRVDPLPASFEKNLASQSAPIQICKN